MSTAALLPALEAGMEHFGITPRRRQLMREVLADPDATYEALASRLFLAPSTVRSHFQRTAEQVGVRTARAQVIVIVAAGMAVES